MPAENHSLIVTAHPDDETIFFAGLILSRPKTRWKVVCVTDGNADNNGLHRIQDLKNACAKLGVNAVETLGFPDKFENRLDVLSLQNILQNFQPDDVYTHGIVGEYGHPHHQDVSLATHRAFHGSCPVYSVAHNCYPEVQVELSREMWQLKSDIYKDCYFSETRRFIQMLPITFHEGFCQVQLTEVEAIYRFLANNDPLDTSALRCYSAMEPYLEDMAANTTRPF